jgi:hypothetical protein
MDVVIRKKVLFYDDRLLAKSVPVGFWLPG